MVEYAIERSKIVAGGAIPRDSLDNVTRVTDERRHPIYTRPQIRRIREDTGMSLTRLIAGMAVLICFIGLFATAQQEKVPQTAPKTQIERCRAAMPTILKNYNNAKYAVFRAGNTADAAHILSAVREAQLSLDEMDQPLKACYEAMRTGQGQPLPEDKK